MSRILSRFERREMTVWAFPIICDLIAERYRLMIGANHESLMQIAFSHSQVWRAMLMDDQDAENKQRGDMRRRLQALPLERAFADEIDDIVLDELMEVVTQRFHKSPVKASSCAHILLQIAKNLTFTPEPLTAA